VNGLSNLLNLIMNYFTIF